MDKSSKSIALLLSIGSLSRTDNEGKKLTDWSWMDGDVEII